MTTDNASTGLRVALAYYEAWSSGDFDKAMTYLSPDLRSLTPAGPISGAQAFREFMEPFTKRVTSIRLLAAYGEGDGALLAYDAATDVRDSAPGAEHHTVADGRIVELHMIFDRLPFELARRAAAGE